MPRDLPCAGCGQLMYRTKKSLPVGAARCHPCRRRAWGLEPNQLVNELKAASQQRRGDCRRCGTPVVPTPESPNRWKYCSEECFRKARNARGSGSVRPKTQDRGYGVAHQRLRAELLPTAYGKPCHLCGDLMDEGDDLHLDHTEDRTGYRGFAHAHCNVVDGARRGSLILRRNRLERGWRPGQDPSTRRRPAQISS